MLFKGTFNETALQDLQQIYQKITSGLTCSIGFGKTLQEVYLALKLAKAEPGEELHGRDRDCIKIVLQLTHPFTNEQRAQIEAFFTPATIEVAELLNLQTIRDEARLRRS